MSKLRGIVERITFQNPDTGYTVARIQPEEGLGSAVTAVGNTLALTPGECIDMEGEWTDHARFGRQFRIETYKKVVPSTAKGIRKYLGSGMIKGIGPVTAKRIVAQFGDKTLEIIERAPQRLREVPGLGPKRAEQIIQAWDEQREIHDVMVFLQSHDVATGHAVKIWKQYGRDAVVAIQENPYRLSRDVWGIGFLTTDRIAQKLGVAPESEQRLLAGLRYVLEVASQDQGHVYLPREELLTAASEALEVPHDRVVAPLERLRTDGEVIVDEERVYLPALFHAERVSASKLNQLSMIDRVETGDLEAELSAIEGRFGVSYAPQQRSALEKALRHSVLVITGGPVRGRRRSSAAWWPFWRHARRRSPWPLPRAGPPSACRRQRVVRQARSTGF